MKILLIGNTGVIGSVLYDSLNRDHDITGINSKILDITNKNLFKDFLTKNHFDLIILNAACKDIQKLEKNPDYAYKINTQPAKIITENTKSRIIFISTDYVFDGQKGIYKDTDNPNPTTMYGKTKNEAEKIIQDNSSNYTIIRTAAVLGKDSVFFEWLLNGLKNKTELEMFEDAYFSPTSLTFLYKIIKNVAQDIKAPKIIHAVGEKRLSRFEFAKIVAKYTNSTCIIKPIQGGFKDYSLTQSEYVKNLQKKTFEQYLKDELKNVQTY